MNMRFMTFSFATAVGICITATQLKAHEPAQPDEVTQDVEQIATADRIGAEQTVFDAWKFCEGWMLYAAAIAIDEVSEQAIAKNPEPQEVEAPRAADSDEIICANESVKAERNSIADEPVAEESLESDAAVSEEAAQVDVEAVQVFEEAVAEVAETTKETSAETITDKDLVQEYKCVEGFDGWIVERVFEAKSLIEEEPAVEETIEAAEVATIVEETVEAIESAELEGNDEIVESVVEEATLEAESAAVVVTPTSEEEVAVEETVASTENAASPVAVEPLDEERSEQETVEEVNDAVASTEEFATDAVADEAVTYDAETLEVVQELIDEVEVQEPQESESIATDNGNEPEIGTARTFELGSCKITITSERQMDDFELLNMLWASIDQLESEMD